MCISPRYHPFSFYFERLEALNQSAEPLPIDSEFPLPQVAENVGEKNSPTSGQPKWCCTELVQADLLGHVAVGLNGIQIGLSIAVVRTPTGSTGSNVVVGFVAGAGTVVGVAVSGVVGIGNQINNNLAAQDLLNGLLVSVHTVGDGLTVGAVGHIDVDGVLSGNLNANLSQLSNSLVQVLHGCIGIEPAIEAVAGAGAVVARGIPNLDGIAIGIQLSLLDLAEVSTGGEGGSLAVDLNGDLSSGNLEVAGDIGISQGSVLQLLANDGGVESAAVESQTQSVPEVLVVQSSPGSGLLLVGLRGNTNGVVVEVCPGTTVDVDPAAEGGAVVSGGVVIQIEVGLVGALGLILLGQNQRRGVKSAAGYGAVLRLVVHTQRIGTVVEVDVDVVGLHRVSIPVRGVGNIAGHILLGEVLNQISAAVSDVGRSGAVVAGGVLLALSAEGAALSLVESPVQRSEAAIAHHGQECGEGSFQSVLQSSTALTPTSAKSVTSPLR